MLGRNAWALDNLDLTYYCVNIGVYTMWYACSTIMFGDAVHEEEWGCG